MSAKSDAIAARRAALGWAVISNDDVTPTARTGALASVKDGDAVASAAAASAPVAALAAPARTQVPAPYTGDVIDTSIAYNNHCGPQSREDAKSASFRSSPAYASGQMPTPNSISRSPSPARQNPMRARLHVVGSAGSDNE